MGEAWAWRQQPAWERMPACSAGLLWVGWGAHKALGLGESGLWLSRDFGLLKCKCPLKVERLSTWPLPGSQPPTLPASKQPAAYAFISYQAPKQCRAALLTFTTSSLGLLGRRGTYSVG